MVAKASGVQKFIASVWAWPILNLATMTPPTVTRKTLSSFLTPFLLVRLNHNSSAACVELILWRLRVTHYLARDVETKCATLSDDLIHGRSLLVLGGAPNSSNLFRRSEEERTFFCHHSNEQMLIREGFTGMLWGISKMFSGSARIPPRSERQPPAKSVDRCLRQALSSSADPLNFFKGSASKLPQHPHMNSNVCKIISQIREPNIMITVVASQTSLPVVGRQTPSRSAPFFFVLISPATFI